MGETDRSNQSISMSERWWIDDEPLEALITTVAEASGESPMKMEPLGNVVDTDAIERLLTSDDIETASLLVAFDYNGYRVTLTHDEIVLDPLEPGKE